MRIVLATGIYPPDIGGPAVFAQRLKEGLERRGHKVKVISYRGLREIPQPFRIFIYFLRLAFGARGCSLIYSLNLISCGLPSCFYSKISGKKLALRIGGDYLWERAVEKGRTKKTLRDYYNNTAKTAKEKFWILIIKIVLICADRVIFTNDLQKNIYQRYFNLSLKKAEIIPNPFPEVEISPELRPDKNVLLYAGRLLKLKNLEMLLRAFQGALKKTGKDLTLKIIGEGPEKDNLRIKSRELGIENNVIFLPPFSHEKLMEEIQRSYFCVLPSLTEITPNFSLECIKLKKPILLTKETGLYGKFKDYLLFCDPQNRMDLEEKIIFLLEEANYSDYLKKISEIPIDWTWENVVEKHEKSFIS